MAMPTQVTAPMQGTIVSLNIEVGQQVRAGQTLMLIESMKMHHPIEASDDGVVEATIEAPFA
mgnify:CR=1 FL=1